MCSPAEYVSMTRRGGNGDGRLVFRIGGHLINEFADGEPCTYPTPCKGRYRDVESARVYYPFQSPSSLNALGLLPQLRAAGVNAVKIEGRQRSHVYVRRAATVFRAAIDELENTGHLSPRSVARWDRELRTLFEGRGLTTACYGQK